MKKLILLSAVFLLSTVTFATTQTDTTLQKTEELVDSVIPDSASLTFKEVYSDIKSGIGALASALEVGVNSVYTTLLKQQYVKSIVNIVTYLIGILILFVSYKQFNKKWFIDASINNRHGMWDMGAVFFIVAFSIFIIISIVYFASSITETITGFINPEYGAIKEILEVIH